VVFRYRQDSKDEVIKSICGLDTICDSTTINRFYNKYGKSSGDIASGEAIGEMGNLMFNVSFKMNILKCNFITREMKSIRYLILSIGAKLIYHGRQLILRLLLF